MSETETIFKGEVAARLSHGHRGSIFPGALSGQPFLMAPGDSRYEFTSWLK